jgi:poly(3-hydroxybutyrate) depolymerase
MRYFASLLFALAALVLLPAAGSSSGSSDEITKELFESKGQKRAYYLYVPKTVKADAPAPLLVTLHGSGRNGLSLVEKWKDLAKKEGFIVAGPDSGDTRQWRIPEDGPDYLHELVEALKAKHPVNARRVYLFGHSAGAGQALYLSLLESEYFAAVAVHAGALGPDAVQLMEQAKRKTPIAIFVGDNDPLFPLTAVRSTRDALNSRGFSAQLTEIKNHNHWYYDRAPEINRDAWAFLKKHELTGEPKYEQYKWSNE